MHTDRSPKRWTPQFKHSSPCRSKQPIWSLLLTPSCLSLHLIRELLPRNTCHLLSSSVFSCLFSVPLIVGSTSPSSYLLVSSLTRTSSLLLWWLLGRRDVIARAWTASKSRASWVSGVVTCRKRSSKEPTHFLALSVQSPSATRTYWSLIRSVLPHFLFFSQTTSTSQWLHLIGVLGLRTVWASYYRGRSR